MSTQKLACLILAALVVAVGSGLLAQTGQGATLERDIDVAWFDRNLVGAHPGTALRLVDVRPCDACGDGSDASAPRLPEIDETRLIAERLDELTVPLLRIDGRGIGYLDMAQIETPTGAATR